MPPAILCKDPQRAVASLAPPLPRVSLATIVIVRGVPSPCSAAAATDPLAPPAFSGGVPPF
eukprot:9876141-Karenia_brevis.AAC.1